jgi:3-deoxy-manno-octulosonate cytidylyltransferase (CMP-KDO synthetase)
MKSTIVIPARYASSRLPGKPLLRETGKYVIQHVYERALEARRSSQVIVATDDPRIVAAVKSFGGNVVMTGRQHTTGTDRVAEVARQLDADVIINLQGDEPLIEPASLDLLVDLMRQHPDADVATLAVPITTHEQWQNPNCVKVVCAPDGRALYFSRSPIPWQRDGEPDFAARPSRFLQHLGLYAYRRSFLLQLASMAPDPIEQIEKLEQLRVLGLGRQIVVGTVAQAAVGVDTYEDYREFVRTFREHHRRERTHRHKLVPAA